MREKFTVSTTEARLFVRHSDGDSFVIPEESEGPRKRLSFSVVSPDKLTAGPMLDLLDDLVDDKDEHPLGDVYPQRLIGTHGLSYPNENGGYSDVVVHGYLAQMHLGKEAHHRKGRQVVSSQDMKDILNTTTSLEPIEKALALRTFYILNGIRFPLQ